MKKFPEESKKISEGYNFMQEIRAQVIRKDSVGLH